MGVGTERTPCRSVKILGASILFTGCALIAMSAHLANAEEVSRQSFWNSEETASSDLRPFSKWRSVLERYAQEMERYQGRDCVSSLFSDCPYEEWSGFLAGIADNDRWGQLVAVNGFVNARRYMEDERNWGIDDYWATPGEFLARAGDCEDYAIAKYLSLKELGWPKDDLRVVVVRDSNLRVAHAVLVVAFGGRTWVLDNQKSGVHETADVWHYRPVFSINETSWWHHRPDNAADRRRRPASISSPSKLDATPAAAEPSPATARQR